MQTERVPEKSFAPLPRRRLRPSARALSALAGAAAACLALGAPAAHADPPSCDCPGGTDYLGNPVHLTTCGDQVCGADFQYYSCQPSGWAAEGGVCPPPPQCDCPDGTDYLGNSVHSTTCGEQICGSDNQYYSCQAGGWASEGGVCPEPARHTMRVIEVRYMPDAPLNHPNQLSAGLRGALREGSRYRQYADPGAQPHLDVEVVDVFDHFAPRPDGADWREVYEQVLADHDLCNRIRDEAIDQVWLWVDPASDPRPGLEYVISSPMFEQGAQYADVASPALCGGERSFAIMGFDTTVPFDNAQHSFGHLMEGLLGNLQSVELFWYRFAGDDAAGFSRGQRCGNVHFPPNGAAGYDYGNPAATTTYCEDWDPYLAGAPSTFGCERWGCTQAGYLKRWMQSLPNENNGIAYEGKLLPNWWDFVFDFDANVARYRGDPSYYLNHDFVPPPLPFGLAHVDTVPASLLGQRNLAALFDGAVEWPHTALIHRPGEPVGVVLEFAAETDVAGFTASVAGDPGAANTTWWVEAADSLADLSAESGSYRMVLGEAHTFSGVTYLPLPAAHRAKAFRVTTRRDSGDGTVHVLELSPTFPGEVPRTFSALATDPTTYPGTKNLPALFDGKGAASGFGVVHYGTPASNSISVLYDHGDRPLTWYGLRVEAGGYVGNPTGQHWKVEAADTLGDLYSHAGSYRLVANQTGDASPTELTFGSDARARLFKVTLTRNEADGVEHIAELTPRIRL